MYDSSFEWLPQAFDECHKRLALYYGVILSDGNLPRPSPKKGRAADLRYETLMRLAQSRWCLERVMRIEQHGSRSDFPGSWQLPPMLNSGPEIWMISEAFYYFAHRFLKLCEKVKEVELQGFYKQVQGSDVLLVRNWLLEHSEKPGGTSELSFAFHTPGGPHVKPTRPDQKSPAPKAPGLYQHAAELITALRETINRRAFPPVPPPPPPPPPDSPWRMGPPGVWRKELGTRVLEASYHFSNRRGTLRLPPGGSVAMQAAVAYFTAMDPGVDRIETFDGERADDVFVCWKGEWKARPKPGAS